MWNQKTPPTMGAGSENKDMDQLAAKDVLELEVSDFGPIVNAKIDLRPLTVFVGPSNTGKSYLAILIYALHRFFYDISRRRARRFDDERTAEMPPETPDVLEKWAKQIHKTRRDISNEESVVLPSNVVDVIRSVLDLQGDRLGREIVRSFGANTIGMLVRKEKRHSAKVVMKRRSTINSASSDHRLTIGAQGVDFRTNIPESIPIRIDVQRKYLYRLRHMLEDYQDRERPSWYSMDILGEMIKDVLPRLIAPLHLPAYYLPADRTGVMHAHSVVVSAMIGSAPMTGLRPPAGTPMLSGVLADFLQQLIELDQPPNRQRMSRHDLGTKIEDTILGGSVQVERSETIGYPHFTYTPEGWKKPLPLMNASSMVSELAPVVLYLRYMVGPGSVLIIEEPESHLHPAMQVEFTRQIASLVKAGVRVIVTTHSEWVLETLANLVRLSELPKARRKGIEGADLLLRPDEVGAWLFTPKRRPKGSVVEEIRFDPDAGGLESDFSEVGRQLYNDWATIGNRIAGSTE